MIIVNDINTIQFEINGIRYFKNFTPVVRNNYISIKNTYGSNIDLFPFTKFDEFEINGVVHANVNDAQIALLPILFTRVSLVDVQNTLPDGLISSGTINVIAQEINFYTGFNARIQGNLVSNNAQSFTLPFAVESRFDSFGINNLGIIVRIVGDDQENPFLPNIPANVIYITSVLITSNSIGEPTEPELSGFVQKIYSSVQNVFDVTTFELPTNGSTYFRFVHQNGNLNFNGFTNANNNPELFDGKDFYIENQSDFPLTLTTGAGIRPTDALTIPARKLTHYKYRGGKLYLVAKSWEGSQVASNIEYLNGSITNVKEALDSLLYVAPDITGFSITPNLVEIGTIVNTITLNWNLNKIFTSLSINNGVGAITPNLLTLTLNSLSLSSNTTYTITGGDGTNNDSASATINFRSRRWWGTSVLDTFTGADILTLQNDELATNRQQTRAINGDGKYIWFAFPTSFGVPSFVVNGLPNSAFTISTVSHTNQSGNTQNYYVIRTNTVQNGTLTIQIL